MNVMRWCLIAFVACATASFGQDNVVHLTAKPAPMLVLKDLNDTEVALTNYAGKTRLFFFWASWDKPSQQQLATLKDIQRNYAASNVVVLGLALDWQNPTGLKNFAATNSINFPILIADYDVIKGFGGVEAIPTTILVEPHGLVVTRFTGLTEKGAITNYVEAVLKSQR